MKTKEHLLNDMSQREDSLTETDLILFVRKQLGLSQQEFARKLNVSSYVLAHLEKGDIRPSADLHQRLLRLLSNPSKSPSRGATTGGTDGVRFFSSGITTEIPDRPTLLTCDPRTLDTPRPAILEGLFTAGGYWGNGNMALGEILECRSSPAPTPATPHNEDISAGKNTYTYDAHTYHTKVPPQGVASIISQYLPDGGVVLDPFAGSGMTGVAARYLGCDVILNELSPAASFIAQQYIASVDVEEYRVAVAYLLHNVSALQKTLYLTTCRECGQEVIQLYTVWSYILECSHCNNDFVLWDHCRQYGRTVREHRILRTFPCPHCSVDVNKSYLMRKESVPVFLGYRCCSKKIVEHPLELPDYARIDAAVELLEQYNGEIPQYKIPNGVNFRQPRHHGLDTVDKLYTRRNLVACAEIWREIRRIADPGVAGLLAFTFTSMYQRVTRLGEYRFWGGSGNTANLNVPQISNELNVFLTFLRKAKTICAHLASTAKQYSGRSVVRTGTATDLSFLPDNSIDFIFTDPPFGGNINYSEMNFLWESWLGIFTDNTSEAIINKHQGKGIGDYRDLMKASLAEAYRVLRPGHWMVLVFMNSSEKVWAALRQGIEETGFSIEQVNVFDKRHGTLKQFTSANTAGADVMIHCRKVPLLEARTPIRHNVTANVSDFILTQEDRLPTIRYLHVDRPEEVDYRVLYSRYIADAMERGVAIEGFSRFRTQASALLEESS